MLREIDDMRRDVRHAVRDTAAKWTDGLRKFLTADAVAASNSIEGFNVSTVDVLDLAEGEHDVDVSDENRAETLAGFAEDRGMDERVITALHDVVLTGRVRRLHYGHGEGISMQQAQRDLRDLVAAQVLKPVGRTRARYYTEGPGFPEAALTAARTPLPVTSPYSG